MKKGKGREMGVRAWMYYGTEVHQYWGAARTTFPNSFGKGGVWLVSDRNYRALLAAWRREQQTNAALAAVVNKIDKPDPKLSGVKFHKCNCERVYGGKRK